MAVCCRQDWQSLPAVQLQVAAQHHAGALGVPAVALGRCWCSFVAVAAVLSRLFGAREGALWLSTRQAHASQFGALTWPFRLWALLSSGCCALQHTDCLEYARVLCDISCSVCTLVASSFKGCRYGCGLCCCGWALLLQLGWLWMPGWQLD